MEWYIAAGGLENLPLYNCELVLRELVHGFCSLQNKTLEEWRAQGEPDVLLGAILFAYGVLVEIIYVPCLSVISRPVYFKISCYKIMVVLGVLDMFAIGVNSLLTGILQAQGAVFCTNPKLIYITGSIGLGLWCAACMSCLVLVCNRLIELWRPYVMDTLFAGNRTFVVMAFPLLYGTYFIFFTQPLCFTSEHSAWFFDPFINTGHEMEYMNIPHTANNLLIVVLTCILYTALCCVLSNKFKSHMSSGMSWNQKSIFIQSTAICMANLVAALIYVYMQFFPTPNVFILIGHISWQFGHGFPAIVYLALNRTIQREVLKMLGLNPHKRFHFTSTGASRIGLQRGTVHPAEAFGTENDVPSLHGI